MYSDRFASPAGVAVQGLPLQKMDGFIHISSPPGFLGHCMENLLWDQKFWLSSLEEDIEIKVSVQEDTLHLIYKGILMQEGTKEFCGIQV